MLQKILKSLKHLISKSLKTRRLVGVDIFAKENLANL